MKLKLILRSVFVFALLICSLEAKIHVFGITNQKFLGDCNQIKGVGAAFETLKANRAGIELREFDLKDLISLTKVIKELGTSEKIIVLSAGDYGVDAILALQEAVNHPGISYTMLSHQITPKVHSAINVVDFIALPNHCVSCEFLEEMRGKKTQLIQTIGVSHNLRKADILIDYEKYKHQLPQGNKHSSVIAVMLGGDAPDKDNVIRYYTIEEATNLAHHVSSFAKSTKAIVLATNGPRTGKHDQQTGKVDETAHKSQKLDLVSQAFVDTLSKDLPKDRFAFYNFQFGEPSMSKTMYGAVMKANGIVLIPGESTSMVSEAIDAFDRGHVFVYQNKAMSGAHEKHTQAELEAGRIQLLDLSFQKVPVPGGSGSQKRVESANMTIARAVLARIEN